MVPPVPPVRAVTHGAHRRDGYVGSADRDCHSCQDSDQS